ncbi:MAG TPA: PilZ domain-containing protein [Fimbriimonadaceae bacterium]|nr:PilZ domain-containing protein [Fimbriimonadaceae bacterium]
MSNEDARADNRKHARFELLDYAMMQGEDKRENPSLRAVIVDVSLGGLQIRSRTKFQHGDIYHLAIGRVDSTPLLVSAEVRYSVNVEGSDLYATGFKVQPEDNAQRIAWVDYVHNVFQSQGEALIY